MRKLLLLIVVLVLVSAVTSPSWAQEFLFGSAAEEMSYGDDAGAGAGALNFPTDLAFTPDGSIAFISEKTTGRVRAFDLQPDGRYLGRTQPFVTVPVSLLSGYHERGLTSVAVDSYYPDAPYIYVYYTAPGPVLRISRFEDVGGVGRNEFIIRQYPLLNNTFRHVASKIRHNLYDGMLYITVGDNNVPSTSGVLSDPHGKLHRVNPYDGSVPDDNPFPGSTVWAYGLRHTYGICLNWYTGDFYAVDNGENCDDRAFKIVPGQDYGWGRPPTPNCPFGPSSIIWRSGSAPGNQVAPTGCYFIWTDAYTGLNPGDMIFGEWNTRNISRVQLSGPDLGSGTRSRFFTGRTTPTDTGRVTDVEMGPADGFIYFVSCTSAQFPTSCTQGHFFRLNP
jgi:glucose/arabinose dehydrogenase